MYRLVVIYAKLIKLTGWGRSFNRLCKWLAILRVTIFELNNLLISYVFCKYCSQYFLALSLFVSSIFTFQLRINQIKVLSKMVIDSVKMADTVFVTSRANLETFFPSYYHKMVGVTLKFELGVIWCWGIPPDTFIIIKWLSTFNTGYSITLSLSYIGMSHR